MADAQMSQDMYDVIIVGGGPAGMTAALYAQRNGRKSLVIEKAGFGGQITNSPKVENYPGSLSISGNELADLMLDQILKQGAEIEFENVLAVKPQYDDPAADADSIPNFFKVFTEEGSVFDGRTVILATGVKHRMLGLPGEEALKAVAEFSKGRLPVISEVSTGTPAKAAALLEAGASLLALQCSSARFKPGLPKAIMKTIRKK